MAPSGDRWLKAAAASRSAVPVASVAWAAATSPPMVLHQDVAKIGQTALLLGAFAVKARILVRRRGDGLEKLEEQSPQKARSGGMDGRPIRSEGGRKSQVELSQRRIGQPPHRPQRGVPRDARLDVHL